DAERRQGRQLGFVGHGLEDAGAGVAARLAALAQVEDEQRIAGDLAAEAGRRPAAGSDEGLDGVAERLDVGHGRLLLHRLMLGVCLFVNRIEEAIDPGRRDPYFPAAASGTTLLACSDLPPRNLLMLRAAWRMRCSFSTSARRTYWSPYSPKPTPGATATPVSWISSLANSSEPISANWSGIGDQMNIVALGDGRRQPARAKLSTITSRRFW